MTTNEFWNEDPATMWSYRNAYIKKMKLEKQQLNFQSYLTGIYMVSAISCTIGNMFGDNKQKTIEYTEMIDLDKIEKESNMTEEEKAQEETRKMEEELKKQVKNLELIFKNKRGEQ